MSIDKPSTLRIEESAKRIRVILNGETVADSVHTKLLFEPGHFPVIYFPLADVQGRFLERTAHTTHCPHKGDASYWTLDVAGTRRENAVWGYETPKAGAEAIAGHVSFYWDKVDAWFEEDQPLLGHARSPYHRIDTLRSSRRVVVRLNGQVVADTTGAVFLYETGMPTRYYIPRADVRQDLLGPSETWSLCPYKGRAAYHSAPGPDGKAQDVAWYYPDPWPEVGLIRDAIAFYPERVEAIEVADH